MSRIENKNIEIKEQQIIKKIWTNSNERYNLLNLVVELLNKFKVYVDITDDEIINLEYPWELFKILYKSKIPLNYIIKKFEETKQENKIQEIKPQEKQPEIKKTIGSTEKQKEFLNKFNLLEKQPEIKADPLFNILYNDLENWFKIHDQKKIYKKTSESDEIFFDILINKIFFYLNAEIKEIINKCIINNKTIECKKIKNIILNYFLKEYTNINYKKIVDEYIKNRKYLIINKKLPEKLPEKQPEKLPEKQPEKQPEIKLPEKQPEKTTTNKKTNKWVEHVRKYAKTNNISYACAISEASKTYEKIKYKIT